LVFVHVPKTAGTTLTSVLTMNAPGEESSQAGNVFKGSGGLKRGVTFKRLLERSGPDLEGVRVVAGHFPLGLRDYLPKERDLRCFTFLREPVDRTLSHYFAIRENREGWSQQGKYALSPLPPEPTLQDMLDGGYVHDNLQTRMLSGDPEPFGEVTEEMLERAKRNLRTELVFLGLTERFDESLVLAKRRRDLRAILYRSDERVNATRPRGDAIPGELVKAAERCNRYDVELYRHACELFDDAPELDELEFQVEVEAFRAARPEGELDLDRPAPAGFGGDEEAWRMLLEARALLLRHEHGFADIKEEMLNQLQRVNEAHHQLVEARTGNAGRGRRRRPRRRLPSS
jgi:Galactose-3-O-sulfotransferase